MANATKLTKLRMEELSGVDAGANNTPGWIVQKSKAVQEDTERFEKEIVGLFEGLAGEDADLYFADADEDVAKAREAILKFIGEDLEEAETEDKTEERGPLAKFRELFVKGEPEKGTVPERENRNTAGDGPEKDENGEPEKGTHPETPDKDTEDDKGAEDLTPEAEAAHERAEAKDKDKDKGTKAADKDKDEKTEKSAGTVDADELITKLAGAVEDQLDPIREAVAAIADRQTGLEKASARQMGLIEDEDSEVGVTKSKATLGDALRVAVKTGRVDLT